MKKLLKVYVCKNDDHDGDLFLAAFTTKELASKFCRENPTFAYYKVDITNNTETETTKYVNGEM